MIEPAILHFEDNGLTPNNTLAVIIYKNIIQATQQDCSDYLESLFQSNQWTNNWRDIVLDKNHYHSTSHEVLGIGKGKVRLWLGGNGGKEVLASEGDVIILPAGVGHFAINNIEDYEVVGGYPNGLDWDMIYDEPEKYNDAKSRIAKLEIPSLDPVYGRVGYLNKLWKS